MSEMIEHVARGLLSDDQRMAEEGGCDIRLTMNDLYRDAARKLIAENGNMIERAARGAYDMMMSRLPAELAIHGPFRWDNESEALREDWRASVRAAIAAMREPTEAMVDAAADIDINGEYRLGERLAAEVWRAMNHAALK